MSKINIITEEKVGKKGRGVRRGGMDERDREGMEEGIKREKEEEQRRRGRRRKKGRKGKGRREGGRDRRVH